MADYNKVAIRMSNFGLNLAHDPSSLPFGQFAQLTNAITSIEGQLTAREGMDAITTAQTADGTVSIDLIKRINDSVQGYSMYLCKIGTKLDAVVSISGIAVNTSLNRYWRSNTTAYISTGHYANPGSMVVYRPSLSNQVWCYVGDKTKQVKVAIDSGAAPVVKNIGIARPTGPPTTAPNTSGSLTVTGTYYYRYTLYDNATGVESLFNSSEHAGETLAGADDEIVVTIPSETVDSAVTHARIYRKGGTLTTWNLITSHAYTGTTFDYHDTNADDAISSADILDEVSDKPFTTVNSSGVEVAATPLPYWWGPANGYMMACGDPVNPGYLYWTNKFNPDSQDPDNNVEVTSPQDPLVNGFVYDNKAYVFSREGLHQMLLGLDSSTWTPFKTSCGHGLYSPMGFCVGPEIYFLSKDGIYATGGGVERSLTDDLIRPLFNNQTVNGYPPIDFSSVYGSDEYHRLVYHRNEIWFSYFATDGAIYTLVYSLIYKRWHMNRFRTAPVAFYEDEDVIATGVGGLPARLVIGGGDGRLYWYGATTSDEQGSPTTIPVAIKTGLITFNAPMVHKMWGPIVFDLNPNSVDVTITLYKNKGATSVVAATYNDATRVRKVLNPGDVISEDLQIEITWATSNAPPIIYGYEFLYKPDAISLTRWSAVGLTHHINGWQILRSGYITLRSDGTTTLSITTQSATGTTTTDTYSIATTAGERMKVFIPFTPRKSRIFTYTLATNSATYFQLYNNECEVHVKPWVTAFGYSTVNPFAGEGESAGGGLEAGGGGGQGGGFGGGGGGGSPSTAGGNPYSFDQFDFLGAGGMPIIPPGPGAPPTSADPTQVNLAGDERYPSSDGHPSGGRQQDGPHGNLVM